MLPDRPVIITIDGPAGTGKSTVAHRLATRLGLQFLDTGAMYRAAALIAIEHEIDPHDGPTLAATIADASLHFDWERDPPLLMVGDRDVSQRIRDMDVSGVVSLVAAQPAVRAVLVRLQQNIAARHPRLVTEGRDQGSVVFPDAPVRFFLHADPSVRAERRIAQLSASGKDVDAAGVLRDIEQRDALDASRRDSPLVRPVGAIDVDTGPLNVNGVVDVLERTVLEELGVETTRRERPTGESMTWFDTSRRAPDWPRRRVWFWWTIVPFLLRVFYRTLYRSRTSGRHHIPRDGPVLYVANHQSHLDPPYIGSYVRDRPFAALARSTLFKGFAGWALRSIGTIPLNQESDGDAAAIRAAIGELKAGRTVLVFPEGARSLDGAIAEFKRGAWLLMRKSTATIVPVAVEGVWDVFPPGAKRPLWRGRIAVTVGAPIDREELLAMGPDAGLDHLRRTIETMRLELRADQHRRSGGHWPKAGAGDQPYWEREATDEDGADPSDPPTE